VWKWTNVKFCTTFFLRLFGSIKSYRSEIKRQREGGRKEREKGGGVGKRCEKEIRKWGGGMMEGRKGLRE
jgi:hypothetical protein